MVCPRRCFTARISGLGARRPGWPSRCAVGREVPQVELRIWPWALSRFVASLKAGPFLLILLIKRICFVRQNRPFIKTEHNFMVFFYVCAKITISPTCHQKQSRGVCVRVCKVSPSHKYLHAKYRQAKALSVSLLQASPRASS